MKKCPYCGAQMNDDSRFCTECGKEFPQGNVCPHCGASINEGDAFCMNCGKAIGNDGGTIQSESNSYQEPYITEEAHSKKINPILIAAVAVLLIGGVWFLISNKGKTSLTQEPNSPTQVESDSITEVSSETDSIMEIDYGNAEDVSEDTVLVENDVLNEESNETTIDESRCWYVFGSKKELTSEGIIKGGKVSQKITNTDYFTEISPDEKKTIKLYSSNVELLSNHPYDSYTLVAYDEENFAIRIDDPQSFWSKTNFMVVVAE